MKFYFRDNPNFLEPNDLETSVWRYMDLEKLQLLIQNNKLYLTRVDLFHDQHECSFPIKNITSIKRLEKTGNSSFMGNELSRSKLKKSYYVSSWRLDNYESDAMWKLYCPEGIGVAIKTSYSKLRNSIPENCYLGLVNYIDYKTEKFAVENRLAPVMHKRKSFSFENEVRIVFPERKFWVSNPDDNEENFKLIDFDFSAIIEKVVVSPYAQQGYYDVVANIPQLEGILSEWSEMKDEPLY